MVSKMRAKSKAARKTENGARPMASQHGVQTKSKRRIKAGHGGKVLVKKSVENVPKKTKENEEKSKRRLKKVPKQPVEASEDDQQEVMAKHHKALLSLQETDPAFFRLLQQDDPELLAFGADAKGGDETAAEIGKGGGGVDEDDFGDLDGGGDDDDDDDDGDNSDLGGLDDDLDEEEEDDEEGNESPRKGGKHGQTTKKTQSTDRVAKERGETDSQSGKKKPKAAKNKGSQSITVAMLEEWERQVFEEHTSTALRQLLGAFKTACHAADPHDPQKPKTHQAYVADTSKVFNRLLVMALSRIPQELLYRLDAADISPNEPVPLLSRSKSWARMKTMARSFANNAVYLLTQLHEPSMHAFTLQALLSAIPLVVCFPKTARLLLKTCVGLWCGTEESVMLRAFLVIRQLSLAAPKQYLSMCMKHTYMGFVKACKFVSAQSWPRQNFMENCMVELYAMDPALTYQHAFVYTRQLAIHLRTALNTRKKETLSTVYNWQYIRSVMLWSRVIGELHSQSLKPLVYPMVQLMLGTISLNPTAQHFPLRLHIVDSLNKLSRECNIFVPVYPLLLDVLQSTHIIHKPRQSTTRPPLLQYILKVPKASLGTKAFQDAVLDSTMGLLLDHVEQLSCHIAYPEVALPIIIHLQKLSKGCENFKLKNTLATAVQQLKENVKYVANHRTANNPGTIDRQAVSDWTSSLKAKEESPLQKYYRHWLKVAETRKAGAQNASEAEPRAAREKSKNKDGGKAEEKAVKRRKKEQDSKSVEVDSAADTEPNTEEKRKIWSSHTPAQQSTAEGEEEKSSELVSSLPDEVDVFRLSDLDD